MTTGTNPDLERKRWARVQLDLPDEATAADAKAEMLRRLPQEDFVPPMPWRQAVQTLHGAPPGNGYDPSLPAREEAARQEIEAFAREMFALSPAERRQRWNELDQRCSFSRPLRARLAELERGVSVDLTNMPTDDQEAALANQVRELLVLRPGERAVRRWEFLFGDNANPLAWEGAAQRLRRKYPAIARLEPDLLDHLASWTANRNRKARNLQMRNRQATQAPVPQATNGLGVLGYVMIGIVLVVIRVATTDLSRTRSVRQSPTPTYQPSVFPQNDRYDRSRDDLKRLLEDIQHRPINPAEHRDLEERIRKQQEAERQFQERLNKVFKNRTDPNRIDFGPDPKDDRRNQP